MYNEIITKVVVDKFTRETEEKYYLDIDKKIDTILGSWVINHKYKGVNLKDGRIKIEGSFDVNIWYSHENNSRTDVISKKIEYTYIANANKITNTSEISVMCIKQPSVINTAIGNGKMSVTINKEMKIKIVDEARVKIKVEDDEC